MIYCTLVDVLIKSFGKSIKNIDNERSTQGLFLKNEEKSFDLPV